jgi:hypothetical protein
MRIWIFGICLLVLVSAAYAADDAASSTTDCEPDWSCTDWSDCLYNNQSRTCNDINFCGIEAGKPIESKSCNSPAGSETQNPVALPIVPPAPKICIEDWKCAPWGVCTDSKQSRVCEDANACGTVLKQPVAEQECTLIETPISEPEVRQPEPVPIIEEPTSTTTSSSLVWIGAILLLAGAGLFGFSFMSRKPAASTAQTSQDGLQRYVTQMRMAGYSDNAIYTQLLNSGYKPEHIAPYFQPPNAQLRSYTKQMASQGYNHEQIEDHLLHNGYDIHDIRNTLSDTKLR